jgi:hypothetical protein
MHAFYDPGLFDFAIQADDKVYDHISPKPFLEGFWRLLKIFLHVCIDSR